MKNLRTLGREERGQEITEFAMISAFVALILLAGMSLLDGGAATVWNSFNAILSFARP